MHNLAGVAKPVSNAVVCVELAKAGVTSFQGTSVREREVGADVVGILTFQNGQEVLFVRGWYYWEVYFYEPMPYDAACELNTHWGKQVRVDGGAGGRELSALCKQLGGVYTYHVDTQEGLNALVQAIDAVCAFGARCPFAGDVPKRNDRLSDWLTTNKLKQLPLSQPGLPLVRSEIAALVGLAGVRGEFPHAEALFKLACKLAEERAQASDHREVRESLATRYREEARRLKGLIRTITSDRDRFYMMCDLDSVLRQRAALLDQLERGNEARAVLSDWHDKLCPLLTVAYGEQIAECYAAIADIGQKEDSIGMRGFYRCRIACYCVSLAKLLRRIGGESNLAEAEQLDAIAGEIQPTLTEKHQIEELETCMQAE